jgi:predicted nucleic acid-binding protein
MALNKKLRVFLDANILIRGITWPRFPYEVLRHAAKGDFVPVFSPMALDSARLYVKELFPEHRVALDILLTLIDHELVPDPPPDEVAAHDSLVRDAKDIPIALAAIQARVEYLVSTDRDFTDVDDTTAELRTHLTPIRVGSFLREVMAALPRLDSSEVGIFWCSWAFAGKEARRCWKEHQGEIHHKPWLRLLRDLWQDLEYRDLMPREPFRRLPCWVDPLPGWRYTPRLGIRRPPANLPGPVYARSRMDIPSWPPAKSLGPQLYSTGNVDERAKH